MSRSYTTKTIAAKGRDLPTAWAAMQANYNAMEEEDPDSTWGTFHGMEYESVEFDPNNVLELTATDMAAHVAQKPNQKHQAIYDAEKAGVITLPNGDFLVFGWVVE